MRGTGRATGIVGMPGSSITGAVRDFTYQLCGLLQMSGALPLTTMRAGQGCPACESSGQGCPPKLLQGEPQPESPMSATVQRTRISLLCTAIALIAISAGICAGDATAKRKAEKAAPRVAQQLRGVNLTPNWEWPGSAGMDDATSARELQ